MLSLRVAGPLLYNLDGVGHSQVALNPILLASVRSAVPTEQPTQLKICLLYLKPSASRPCGAPFSTEKEKLRSSRPEPFHTVGGGNHLAQPLEEGLNHTTQAFQTQAHGHAVPPFHFKAQAVPHGRVEGGQSVCIAKPYKTPLP